MQNKHARAKQSRRQNSETIFWPLLGWPPAMPALVSVISHYGGSVQARAIPMQNWRAAASWPRVHDSGRIEAIADTSDLTRESYSGHSELHPGMSGSTRLYVCMCVCILLQAFCPFFLLAWTERLLQYVKELKLLRLILQGCVREDASSFIAAQNPVSLVLESPCKACICLPSMGRREETVSQYSAEVRRVKDVWGVRKVAKAGASCQLLLDYELKWAVVACFFGFISSM